MLKRSLGAHILFSYFVVASVAKCSNIFWTPWPISTISKQWNALSIVLLWEILLLVLSLSDVNLPPSLPSPPPNLRTTSLTYPAFALHRRDLPLPRHGRLCNLRGRPLRVPAEPTDAGPAPSLRHRAPQRRHRPGTLVVTRLRHHRRHAADQAAAALADAAPGPLPHRLLHSHRQVHRSVPNGDLLSGVEGEVGEGVGFVM